MKMSRKYFFLLMGLLFAFNLMAGDKNSFLKRQFTTSDGYKLNYRILYPENYSPDKKYPLLLFLHGAGERGNDNEKQLFHGGDMLSSHENRSKYPCIILAPQCPENDYWVDYTHPETGMKRTYPENPAPSKQIKAVKELLDSYIAKDIVDTKRISVFGLSMGGMGRFDLGWRYPDLFVTATPICGAVNTKRLGKYKGKTAFRLYHGSADETVDVHFSRDAYETLKKIGADVRYTEYENVNHNSWTPAFNEPDFLSWIFEHSF